MANEKYVQVGFFSLRDPSTREFLEPVPLYIEETDETKASEAKLCEDLGAIFADKMKQYQQGVHGIESTKPKKEKEKV